MRIYKLANIIAIPVAFLLLYFISLLLYDPHDLRASWAVIPLIALVLIYLFQPQIDYWWITRSNFELEEELIKFISLTNPFYNQLSEEEKKDFQKRIILYINGKSFTAKGMEKDNEVPYDMKCMIAQIPVSIMFHSNDMLLKHYDHIVVYKHAFPSPRHRFLHTYEMDKEDGVIIFSMEHTEAAFLNKEQFYNVAWHAFSEAYLAVHPESQEAINAQENWSDLLQLTGFDKEHIIKTLGFEFADFAAVALSYYFLEHEKMKKTIPELAGCIEKQLRLVST